MRYGFTTGSCAAAAAKAAAYMLLTGREKTEITIETPKGIPYTAQIRNICRKEQEVSCAVEKDGGDDPDITTGALICAKVSFAEITDRKAREEPGRKNGTGHAPEQAQVVIDGGIGVGRVTKPGLDQPVGNAAINHVPREMIEREVLQVCQVLDYRGILSVEISVPEGEKLAEKTFNPRLGIVGGISILGTSGVVEPMSTQAILDTIRVELRQQRALGREDVVISPGNYGLDFLKNTYHYDLDKSVKCSNFIGLTIDMAVEEGFRRLTYREAHQSGGRYYEYPFPGGRLQDGAVDRFCCKMRCSGSGCCQTPVLCHHRGSCADSGRVRQETGSHGLCHGAYFILSGEAGAGKACDRMYHVCQ